MKHEILNSDFYEDEDFTGKKKRTRRRRKGNFYVSLIKLIIMTIILLSLLFIIYYAFNEFGNEKNSLYILSKSYEIDYTYNGDLEIETDNFSLEFSDGNKFSSKNSLFFKGFSGKIKKTNSTFELTGNSKNIKSGHIIFENKNKFSLITDKNSNFIFSKGDINLVLKNGKISFDKLDYNFDLIDLKLNKFNGTIKVNKDTIINGNIEKLSFKDHLKGNKIVEYKYE